MAKTGAVPNVVILCPPPSVWWHFRLGGVGEYRDQVWQQKLVPQVWSRAPRDSQADCANAHWRLAMPEVTLDRFTSSQDSDRLFAC